LNTISDVNKISKQIKQTPVIYLFKTSNDKQ
jgi:hypothetical protein